MRSEDVRERLAEYRAEGRVTAEQTDRFLGMVRQDRGDWRGGADGSVDDFKPVTSFGLRLV